MGFEYRLHIDPPLTDVGAACAKVFDTTDWKQIPTSFTDIAGIGVQRGELPADPSWPHSADLHLEDGGSIYVLCHNSDGGSFMRFFVEQLEQAGHHVKVDDDI